jgi:hypothetical protein
MAMKPDTPLAESPTQPGLAPVRSTDEELEFLVVIARLHLYNHGRPCGAVALRRHLHEHYGVRALPSTRPIGRILVLYGLTHGRTGWYEGDEPDWLPQSSWVPRQERRSI